MEVTGEYNTADVKLEEVDEGVVEQVGEMLDARGFEGPGNVRIMPDCHIGAGAVIGFTMPLGDRVVPNCIGVDIGCGMLAINIGQPEIDWEDEATLAELDANIRKRVPTGFDVFTRSDYHMHNDFPWTRCTTKLRRFNENSDFEEIDAEYGPDYFDDLTARLEYDPMRAINSIGSLGGGNHFIEIGRAEGTGDYWAIIHSGSRGIGATIAQYWQYRATSLTTKRRMDPGDVPEDVREYLTDDWKPAKEKIREDFEEDAIQEMFDKVSIAIAEHGPKTADRDTSFDYLEGTEAHGYVVDMIFAQTFASESRLQMAKSVAQAVHEVEPRESIRPLWTDSIESVHNYIDFTDTVIRKGACRARDGESLVVPLNMGAGTLLCRGEGKDSWNNSAPHGAGRAMSRTQAEAQFSTDDMAADTEGVFMSETPLDETPGAYKDPEMIEEALGPTATVIDRVVPVFNLKAP